MCVYFEIFYVVHCLRIFRIIPFGYRYCTTVAMVLHNFVKTYRQDYLRTFGIISSRYCTTAESSMDEASLTAPRPARIEGDAVDGVCC